MVCFTIFTLEIMKSPTFKVRLRIELLDKLQNGGLSPKECRDHLVQWKAAISESSSFQLQVVKLPLRKGVRKDMLTTATEEEKKKIKEDGNVVHILHVCTCLLCMYNLSYF